MNLSRRQLAVAGAMAFAGVGLLSRHGQAQSGDDAAVNRAIDDLGRQCLPQIRLA
jgi:hypothetical protein